MGRIASSLIDGSAVESANEQTFDAIDPSTGRIRGQHPAGSVDDVNRAVASARRAFESGSLWNTPPSHRKKVLHALADLMEGHPPQSPARRHPDGEAGGARNIQCEGCGWVCQVAARKRLTSALARRC